MEDQPEGVPEDGDIAAPVQAPTELGVCAKEMACTPPHHPPAFPPPLPSHDRTRLRAATSSRRVPAACVGPCPSTINTLAA